MGIRLLNITYAHRRYMTKCPNWCIIVYPYMGD